jgi:hypothetical protein
MSQHGRRHAKGNRRAQNTKTRHRARVVGLGTAAGVALTFGMTPLAAVAPAHADLLDLLIDPIADWLSGAVAGGDSLVGDIGAQGLGAADPAWWLPSDLAAGLASPAKLVDDIEQAWIDSPLGQLLDSIINASGLNASGHGAVGNGGAETVEAPPATPDGLVLNDGGAMTVATSATEPAPSEDLAATYAVSSQWDGGFVADYTIDNSGSVALNNWQLQFNLPAGESITSVWNATLTQSGTHYVLTPDSYDSTIAPDGSVNVGFQAVDTGTYAPPTQVTVDGQPVDGGAGTTTTGGGDTSTTSTSTTTTTTSSSTTTTGGSEEEFSPYFDVTLYPAFNYSSAADAGIKDATLAFIVADGQGQPAWGGYSAYAVDGGSDISYINNQISAMEADGISPTISFGGEDGTYLADVPGQTVSGLENDYLEVVNAYGIHKLDFDIEGAAQRDTSALAIQAQALAELQTQEAADGTPVTISYTLPVLPTGLTASGLEPLEMAKEYGVDVSTVNIMAMDYGPGFDGGANPGMGEYAIEAAEATHNQLMQLYPDLSSAKAWSMIGVTPLIGINDDPNEIFTLADAQQLTEFAEQNHIGELSMWAGNKDVEGTLGATDQVDGSGIVQTPWAFSKIFEQFAQ